jgi:predicted RNA methylase
MLWPTDRKIAHSASKRGLILQRYGKSSEGILNVQQSFFEENEASLQLVKSQAEIYIAQPRRTSCKLCNARLPDRPDFTKLSIPYVTCTHCSHLNGMHEDTDAFCRAVYLDESYASYYGSADAERYRYRTDAIYRPKADFLAEALAAEGHALSEFSCADFGAGSGYMVAALLGAGADRTIGIEVSPHQVAYAKQMVGADRFRLIDIADTVATVRGLDADVVTIIGVLEHLQDQRAVLQALRDNPRVEYMLLCVPLYGLCVFLEMVFPNIHPRHLIADHTHLFTEQSLRWMEQAYGFERCAEWWFGSDMLDLYRQVLVSLSQKAETSGMTKEWTRRMRPLIDPMQLAIDRQRLASEVHLVLRKR